MTSFQIKILAISTMLIDHIGAFIYPDDFMYRVVGRLSFPLFAWLIANGAYYTKNIDTYLKRLFIFALISQIPFYLANNSAGYTSGLNVLFTFFFALIAIKIIRNTPNKLIWVFTTLICMVSANILKTNYEAFGVLATVLFYIYFSDIKSMALAQIFLHIMTIIIKVIINLKTNTPLWNDLLWFVGPLGVTSLIFISQYNKKSGFKDKYLLYAVYPLQYLVFYIINIISK